MQSAVFYNMIVIKIVRKSNTSINTVRLKQASILKLDPAVPMKFIS